jgi:hypothetical protein
VETALASDTITPVSKTFLLNPVGDKILAVLDN